MFNRPLVNIQIVPISTQAILKIRNCTELQSTVLSSSTTINGYLFSSAVKIYAETLKILRFCLRSQSGQVLSRSTAIRYINKNIPTLIILT